MKRVLIVSPRFPPRNAPDLHRVRASLAHYEKFGWTPTVLCVGSSTSDGIEDATLAESLPDTEVLRVDAWPESSSRRFGFGHLDYRCLWPMQRAGTRLLAGRRFDVVFFSTTAFLTFTLGPGWKRRFGCKLVYDMQDPWYTDEALYDRTNVPGTWWKYRMSRAIARRGEAFAMRAADHVISVSPAYVDTLGKRYPWLAPSDFSVIPFGACPEDFEFMRAHRVTQREFERAPGTRHWVYAGRVGPDMERVLTAFFAQVAKLRAEQPAFFEGLTIHFVGTNYSPESRTCKMVEPLALQHGVADLVKERPARISYFETLKLYESSDAVLLFGADARDYTASKLFNCVLSGRPVLTMFHAQSLVADLSRDLPNVFLAAFRQGPQEPEFAARLAEGLQWLPRASFDASRIPELLAPWSAQALTRAQCEVFDRVSAA